MYDESKHTQAEGNAVAVSGGAGTVATVQWLPESSSSSFSKVPAGKRLIITDVLLNPQLDVASPHTVNLAEKNADGTQRIFFQFRVPPGATQQAHFHTGHVIEAGKSVVTFTDANPPAGQHFSLALNAYLTT